MESSAVHALSEVRSDQIPAVARYAAGLAVYRSFNEDSAMKGLLAEVGRLRTKVLELNNIVPTPIYLTRSA